MSYSCICYGSYAKSCNDYRNPPTGYKYIGAIGDGIYRIQPDSGTPFNAYCDMTEFPTEGWTMIFSGGMSASSVNAPLSLFNGTSTENYNFTVLGTVMNTQNLMNVINRVPFKTLRFGNARSMVSSTTSTFKVKYEELTDWISSDCQTSYASIPRNTYAGWNIVAQGKFTTSYSLLGCSTLAVDPQDPQIGDTIDYNVVGLRLFTTAADAPCDQGSYACDVYYLYGISLHRSNVPYNLPVHLADKSYQVWIK